MEKVEAVKYEGGEMKKGVWYLNEDVYEKYEDDDHRATIDKSCMVTVYCDDGSYELPVSYFQAKDLLDARNWADRDLNRRCNMRG